MITTPESLTGEEIKRLRNRLGMPQDKFWKEIGVCKSMGSAYEKGAKQISHRTRNLAFIHYVCGIPTNDPEKLLTIGEMARIGSEVMKHYDRKQGGADGSRSE